VFAAMISLSLVLSLFHCCCLDVDAATPTVSIAQSSCDTSSNTTSGLAAPHCCHCLAHVTTVATQDSAVGIDYVARHDRVAAAPMPDAADLGSPFKPPRA
jgi:hypothetical protein